MKTDFDDNDKKTNVGKYLLLIIVLALLIGVAIWYFNKENNNTITYTITLYGDKYIQLNIGEEYIESGYKAVDSLNNDLTSQVKIINELDVNQEGIYKITYQLEDKFDYRIVEVIDNIDKNIAIELSKNIEELTNLDIEIKYLITGETFDYLLLPDGSISYEPNGSFVVKENGSYLFEAYNKEKTIFTKEIVVENIDKEVPKGTCTATLYNKYTEIVVDASDNSLMNYNYYDNSKLLLNSALANYKTSSKTSKKITVDINDEAGNKVTITCKTIDNTYYEVIKPSSSDNVISRGESETLKFYIIKKGSYYLTRIWARNPYLQLNKFDSPEYGSKLYTPKQLLEKANAKYNLTNKLVLGFNASGFYLKDQYDAASVSKYSKYDKTSVGTIVITNGKLIRNTYDKSFKTWYTIGINKENKMIVYTDSKATTDSEINSKKILSNNFINSGIRNTFTFAAPIILNGKKTGITTSMPGGFNDYKGLQMICQINDNNFALFTSTNATRNQGINEFLSMGCQTAMNLDGGGSVGLLYKAKGTNELTKVVGGLRALPEVGYFTE